MNNLKILHITPHTGGGVGNVLKIFDKNFDNINQSFICLDKIKTSVIKKSLILDDMINNIDKLLEIIGDSDIVLLHFWNHPLLYKFLLENKLPKCRLILWSHTLGIYQPYKINKNIIDISDMFILASDASYFSEAVLKRLPSKKIKVIRSTGNIESFLNLKPLPHSYFNILYVGTLDYSKLHPDFVKMCLNIKDENVKFILCGDISSEVKKDIYFSSNPDKFSIEGKVDNIKDYLQISDIFGYPLSENNYSTGELVLGEAMAAGVVPVVLNNLPESFIINNGYNGLIVKPHEYANAINLLKNNKELKEKISLHARKSAKEIYSIETMLKKWKLVINNIMTIQPTEKQLTDNLIKKSGFEIFINSIEESKNLILNYKKNKDKIIELFFSSKQWLSETKASPKHYLSYFPEDKDLQNLVQIIDDFNNGIFK